ncbi:hypothetical protein [Rubripirellula reticaptiva]|uniref:hypothetical protein n=1 Tax=Rubripirellula reticaptiva TaxID=2528013 RepID=UPI001C987079|nr:hypothetical protein [Rubripirellula reticaptiva]
MPRSTVAFAEVSDLGSILETIVDHPLRSKLEALPAYDTLMQSGGSEKLQMGLRAFEASMGKPWQQALGTLSDRGITVALDSANGGAAVLVHSSDTQLLERFRGFVLALRQMQGGTAKQGDYRGFIADMVSDKLKMVRMHDWLLLTNNSELGKAIIDQYLDRADQTLATNPSYVAAKKDIASVDLDHRAVTAFADIKALRDLGFAKGVFKDKVDNIIAEIVLGGLLANIRNTPYVTAQADLSSTAVSLRLGAPHQRDWESPREYFFGEPELAIAPPLLNVPNQLFALSTHRDLSQMWLRSGDFLSDRANDQIAVADTTLTTIFSGRDFGDDILGSLKSDVQLIGVQQDFTGMMPQPAIKLPSFAIQFQMKNPDETQTELRRVFQSLIGFLNVTGAQNGQPQLDLGMETVADAKLITASYVPDRDNADSLDERIQFNFSPTIAFAGERVVLSSSTALARELVKTAVAEAADDEDTSNTTGKLVATTLQGILKANRSQLVANNMLEKGHSKEAAEGEIDLLLELLGFLDDVRLNLDITESQMALEFAVRVMSNTETQQ